MIARIWYWLRLLTWACVAQNRVERRKLPAFRGAPTFVVYDLATRSVHPGDGAFDIVRHARREARRRLAARHHELVMLLEIAGCSAPPEATAEVFEIINAQRKLDSLDATL